MLNLLFSLLTQSRYYLRNMCPFNSPGEREEAIKMYFWLFTNPKLLHWYKTASHKITIKLLSQDLTDRGLCSVGKCEGSDNALFRLHLRLQSSPQLEYSNFLSGS